MRLNNMRPIEAVRDTPDVPNSRPIPDESQFHLARHSRTPSPRPARLNTASNIVVNNDLLYPTQDM